MKFIVSIDIKVSDVEKLQENAEHYEHDMSVKELLERLLKIAVDEEVKTTYTTLW